MAKNKSQTTLFVKANIQKLSTGLTVLSLLLVVLVLLRYPQIAALMHVFEDFAKVSNGIQATQAYLVREMMIIFGGLGVGWFLHKQKGQLHPMVSYTSLLYFLYLGYRVLTDSYILLMLSI